MLIQLFINALFEILATTITYTDTLALCWSCVRQQKECNTASRCELNFGQRKMLEEHSYFFFNDKDQELVFGRSLSSAC